MVNPVFSAVAWVAQRARVRFLQQSHQAKLTQEHFLRSLLSAHKDTEWGQTFGFADIQTIDQYRQRVPIHTYSDFEPAIERMTHGESNVLIADKPVFFNLTSGTTGNKKMIPVTRRSRQAINCSSQAAMGILVESARQQGLPLGKMLFTSSANSLGYTPSGVPYGPISTSDLALSSFIHRQLFAYPFEALQVSDSLARHYLCLLFALHSPDCRILGATFPVLALRLAHYLETHGEALVEDLANGTIAPWLTLDPNLRLILERYWSAAPKRAEELRSILKTEGRLTPHLALPQLSFMVTARAGTSNFYFERFPDYFGNLPVFGGVYSSAEATFGVHRAFNTDDTILAVESGFFEFIPEDQWEVTQPKTKLPWEVTPGDRYRIVVTNYSGFYRYDIGDVVEVTEFHGEAPRFIFRHRRGGVISSTTEKTTEFHVTQTMQALQQEFGIVLENFCITLSNHIPAHYLVNIELASGYHLENPTAFLQRFDIKLSEVHESYAVKRVDHQVPTPQLRILKAGSFNIVRQRMIQRGVAETQIKFPLVSSDRAFLQDLPVIQEVVMEPEVTAK